MKIRHREVVEEDGIAVFAFMLEDRQLLETWKVC